MNKTKKFYKSLENQKIAFIGTGVSHNDLMKLFLKKGLDVTLCDKKTSDRLGTVYNELAELGCKFSLGENYLDEIYNSDVVFRTPGMYFNSPALEKARSMGIAVTSETEVFFDVCPCDIIGITGTEGKTTTTTVISEMLAADGRTVHKGGNIGRALLPEADNIGDDDITVAELSSFQLISMRSSPKIALITNVYPDHLNVHKDMDEYINAKKNLIIHQNAFSRTVLNADNEITASMAPLVRGELRMFSTKTVPERGAFLDAGGMLCYNDGGNIERIVHKDDIKIPGMHNVENYLAAITVLWGDVSVRSIVNTAKNFGGVEHRIEYVRCFNGVKYYNDSIATSPVSVIAGLNAFSQRLIVIAGGSDKNLDYSTLAEPISTHAKLLILMGQTADKIEAAVRAFNPECRIIRLKDMEEAVITASKYAVGGDIVTLSPASASFDMYSNFEERGLHYKSIVNSLK